MLIFDHLMVTIQVLSPLRQFFEDHTLTFFLFLTFFFDTCSFVFITLTHH